MRGLQHGDTRRQGQKNSKREFAEQIPFGHACVVSFGPSFSATTLVWSDMASPLVGYNTNVRHHGKVFHIQTEDSGLSHGHIFTHLFADGGRIVATKKTTYSQYIGSDRFPAVVKKLMQAQHKAMFIALRDGLFDTDEVQGAKEFAARSIVLDEERAAADAIDVTVTPPIDAAKPIEVRAVAPVSVIPVPVVAVAAVPLPEAPPSSAILDIAALEEAAQSYSSAGGVSAVIDHGPTVPGTIASPLPQIPQIPQVVVGGTPSVRTFAKPDAAKAPGSGKLLRAAGGRRRHAAREAWLSASECVALRR